VPDFPLAGKTIAEADIRKSAPVISGDQKNDGSDLQPKSESTIDKTTSL
jgi:hypothetical protein